MHDKPIFIEQPGELERACRRWMARDAIALDTEFERTRTYYSRPALVQIFDGERVTLIDPLAADDFTPLAGLLRCPDVVKVMHAAEGDIEILEQLTGAVPEPVFDTQIAAAFAGHGYSLGYRKLVEILLGEELAKGETRSDWLRRPLSDAQVNYAALDVVHLLPMYTMLTQTLADLGRDAWLREEIARVQKRREADRDPRRAYLRIRATRRLDGIGRSALRELAAWRELEARERDLPRRTLLADDALLAIAAALPSDAGELAAIQELPVKAASRYADALLPIIAAARIACDEPPPQIQTGVERRLTPLLRKLKELVRERAENLAMPAPLLAQTRTLEALVQAAAAGDTGLPEELGGWREAVIGRPLLDALETMRDDVS